MTTPAMKVSTGFNLPFSGDELLQNFSTIHLKNGATEIDATRDLGGNGGATQIKAGGFQVFNSGSQAGGTISYRGNGTQFFSTPTADTSQSVSVQTQGGAGTLKVSQSAKTSNQTLANKLYGLNTGQGLLIAGTIGAAILLFVFLRK